MTPKQSGSAVELFFGSETGDADGGEAWSVSSPVSLDWSGATGAAATGDRNAGMAMRVLSGGANVATGTATVTRQTGLTAAAAWGAITTAISPRVDGPTTAPQPLPKYAYLGAKQRSTTLSSGVVEMGARVYVPQLGRFLQVDPVYGGSANAYEYAEQDPGSKVDLDGRCTRIGRAPVPFRQYPEHPISPGAVGWWEDGTPPRGIPCRFRRAKGDDGVAKAMNRICVFQNLGAFGVQLLRQAGVRVPKRIADAARKVGKGAKVNAVGLSVSGLCAAVGAATA